MSSQILKWDIPVDDGAHQVSSGLGVVHVACQHDYESVQIWTLEDSETVGATPRWYQVFGTGQPIPKNAHHVGTALSAQGSLVWHVFDVTGVIYSGS